MLDGAPVTYGSATELRATLDYDLSQEKLFNYRGLSEADIIHHLALFVSRLWQIHVFEEGNTRTTAVFFIKYLRTLGYSAANDIFADNAWYFRNALVRANYTDLQLGVHETTEYLEAFLENLLLGKKHELRNRYLHIRAGIFSEKVDIDGPEVDIKGKKVDIDGFGAQDGANESEASGDADAHGERPSTELTTFTAKTAGHVQKLLDAYGYERIFSRSNAMRVVGLKAAGASKLLANLRSNGVIEAVPGHGKGKYRFRETVEHR